MKLPRVSILDCGGISACGAKAVPRIRLCVASKQESNHQSDKGTIPVWMMWNYIAVECMKADHTRCSKSFFAGSEFWRLLITFALTNKILGLIWIQTVWHSESVLEMFSKRLIVLTFYFAVGDFCRLLINFANSLDPDQARQNVGPDLDPNRLTLWCDPERLF